ncbi:ABC-F family ATP-binding cassette domain-containing protein [Chryseolinea lacunae]|uniref:ABC-F family ATP-binding cassette domain-containing protein n=1 Tax=Chryseolinea lacunae TaxID=2801331 RepID=A0ABS1KN36_9BACT|nr:ABC-F family ATP-binding cassette domain-containing protein [Chryseolinea lacunae]MBL0740753.1 ABC-F family ATP-binding cassette domain-containing protein [Chryseolinea lacunae]
MLTLHKLSYMHSNGDVLFDDISLSINTHQKIALVGNNGAGKSSLLKIMAGDLSPSRGSIAADTKPYYVPQHVGQFNDLTLAQALHVDRKLAALKDIVDGYATETNLTLLNDDWLLEERCGEALANWKLEGLDLNRKMATLSGGQKTKVFLAGIAIHQPDIVLLDEPSNHLDASTRKLLYEYITTTSNTLVVVSHDRILLNLLPAVYELSRRGIAVYGGNYDFYAEQKKLEGEALVQDLKSKEKALRKAKEVERESLERKQKLDARGKKKQEKAGLPTISMNTFRNNAEKSTSRLKDVHTEKIDTLAQAASQIRKELPVTDTMKIDLDNAALHRGKKLIEAKDINVGYGRSFLWKQPLNFSIASGERIVIKGDNGSGKTTLIKLMLGEVVPQMGTIQRATFRTVYIDQDYSMINRNFTVYEQAQHFNDGKLPEHDVKIRLNRFLFSKEFWDNSCEALSGGEKMRLVLCCLMIGRQAPDAIVLDEPTNNLDIQNTEILTNALKEYTGTLIMVSHDRDFIDQMKVKREIVVGG